MLLICLLMHSHVLRDSEVSRLAN